MPKNKTIVRLSLAELVEDLTIYPRHEVDESHVQRLYKALHAGAEFPPLVADAKTKRLIDGFHRRRAYWRQLGSNAVVDVELRSYADDAEMILDAIAMNASHGKPLERQDQIRSIHMAEAAGLPAVRIAAALHISEQEITRISVRVVHAPQETENRIPGTTRVALKGSMLHLSGQHLNREQAEAISSMPGSPLLTAVQQVYKAVAFDLANFNDPRLLEALRRLRALLIEKLPDEG